MLLATSISTTAAATVDDYFLTLPAAMREACAAVRNAIRHAAPQVNESIRYLVPTFGINGHTIQLAAFDHYALLVVKKFSGESSSLSFTAEHPLKEDVVRVIVQSLMDQG